MNTPLKHFLQLNTGACENMHITGTFQNVKLKHESKKCPTDVEDRCGTQGSASRGFTSPCMTASLLYEPMKKELKKARTGKILYIAGFFRKGDRRNFAKSKPYNHVGKRGAATSALPLNPPLKTRSVC